ncbi:MAG: hypothetical protein ACM3PE_09885 [Deltaproteobacteria bacterium]
MANRRDIRYVFTSSNTYDGFHSFIPDLVKPLQRVYILKGAPGSGKSTFIRMLGESLSERGYEVDFWLSAADPLNPEGLYLPRLDLAVVNGSQGLGLDPHYPGATGEVIGFEQYQDREALRRFGSEIIGLIDRLEAEREKVEQILMQAAGAREDIKKNVSQRLQLGRVIRLADQLEGELFQEGPAERHFYASSFSAEGTINYVDEISRSCQRRYVLKGPPGSGKSIIIAEIAERGRRRGWYLEYYHCGLDYETMLMLLIPSQGIALIDAGNAELNLRPWDVVIDMNEYLEEPDSPEQVQETAEVERLYETLLLQAQEGLESSQKTLLDLKKIYSSAMDFSGLERRREELLEEIINNH